MPILTLYLNNTYSNLPFAHILRFDHYILFGNCHVFSCAAILYLFISVIYKQAGIQVKIMGHLSAIYMFINRFSYTHEL